MKKAVFFLIFFLLIGGTVFYFGWVQFAVPAGMTGVLVSKTGGVNMQSVENGVFRWQWELLIPTNSTIRLFSKTPVTASNQIAGQLPSAAVYGSIVPGKPDFFYNFTIQTVLTAKPTALPELVFNYNLSNQSEFENYLREQAKNISQSAAAFLLANSKNSITEFSTEDYLRGINATVTFPLLDVISINVTSSQLPDMALYDTAKRAYTIYEEQTRTAMIKASETQAVSTASDSLEISRLKSWGELLNQYPIIIEFLAVSNGTENQLEILQSLRKQNKQ